ncbi:hypothetical protein AVEN_92444-1 [Araneus ventricosus]|uniref:Uncharacterized protein n=1 Tax=Araneus ventricosus TaxID=182803 RepID=A0A4Y2AJT7_ARAVE|nr:hypothetical protein AVEN_92444-1 [Araneus ventricosus]
MCGNANYEPDDDIILESTQIIPQTDEDCLYLLLMNHHGLPEAQENWDDLSFQQCHLCGRPHFKKISSENLLFSATDVYESNQNLQHAETAENPSSQVPNEEQSPSSTSAVPSTDVPAPDSPPSDVLLDSSSMRSIPVPTSPSQVSRRSRRNRRPPKRLDF